MTRCFVGVFRFFLIVYNCDRYESMFLVWSEKEKKKKLCLLKYSKKKNTAVANHRRFDTRSYGIQQRSQRKHRFSRFVHKEGDCIDTPWCFIHHNAFVFHYSTFDDFVTSLQYVPSPGLEWPISLFLLHSLFIVRVTLFSFCYMTRKDGIICSHKNLNNCNEFPLSDRFNSIVMLIILKNDFFFPFQYIALIFSSFSMLTLVIKKLYQNPKFISFHSNQRHWKFWFLYPFKSPFRTLKLPFYF